MKYTAPTYKKEQIETVDIMEQSPFNVAYIEKQMAKLDENGNPTGEMETVQATQVTVDFGSLTQQY